MMITKCCFSELLKNVRANVIHCSVIFKNVPASVLWLRVLLLPTADGTPLQGSGARSWSGLTHRRPGLYFQVLFHFLKQFFS